MEANTIKPKVVSLRDAAAMLGVTVRHPDKAVLAMIRRGELRGVRVGKRVMVTISSLEKLIGEPV